MTPEQAREQFRKVSAGRRVRKSLSIDEAKARLREVDAELEISPAIDYLNRLEWRNALFYLIYWTSTPNGRATLAPVLLRLISIVSLMLGLLRRLFVHKSDQKPEAAPPDNDPAAGAD